MTEEKRIIKVLDFFIRSQELEKGIMDRNYSISDHIFGSMILATCINSEFNDTDDLSKIIRSIYFTEFNSIYPDYNLSTELDPKYYSELKEARDVNTLTGKLVFKYKILDILLTELIRKDPDNLVLEGSKLISRFCKKNESECEQISRFYYLNSRLKNKVRSGWDNKHWNIKADRIERISEHIVGTIGLAISLDSEFKHNLDVDKILKTLVIHETGETIIPDYTPFDGISEEEIEELEHRAMIDALGNLKEKDYMFSLLCDFDKKNSKEAKYAYYCDKIQADLKSKVYQDNGLHHTLSDQENNVVFKSRKAKQMIKDGSTTPFDIWYNWDKTIYEGDKQFPEFIDMLNIAKEIDLIYINKKCKIKK